MQRSTAKRRIVSNAPIAAIAVSNSPQRQHEDSRFGHLLVVFMRIVAALWIFEGLMQWGAVIVTNIDGRSGLATLSTPAVVAVVFFAVINLIASVGLWLATPWGGVIWLVTAGAQLFVIIIMPGFFDHPILTALSNLVLIGVYLTLTWLVAAARDAAFGAT